MSWEVNRKCKVVSDVITSNVLVDTYNVLVDKY